jgi:hypothetical protein
MQRLSIRSTLLTAACGLAMLAATGCHPAYPPPPPPPPQLGPSPLVQLADRNGFETGRADGARDAYAGIPFHARRTRAFHDTPGYDPQLGPFPVYRDAFRNAYLRGYDRGYYRR